MSYQGDDHLQQLLKKYRIEKTVPAVYDIMSGVLAAPDDIDPNSWQVLISDQRNPDLDQQLYSLRQQLEKYRQDELSVAASKSDIAKRLKLLRDHLQRQKLDGFIIPRTDEYQGEYIAAYAERLGWLSGFTGSSGLAVVLGDQAGLFVDGRYILQAAQQTDSSCFQVFLSSEQSSDGWLNAQLKKGQRIGIDPWLHTPNQLQRLKNAIEKAHGHLVMLEQNPIDEVWAGRPPRPLAPVNLHPLQYAGWSTAEKAAILAKELQQKQLDAVVLTAPESVAWLLNVRGGDVPNTPFVHSFVIFYQDQQIHWYVDTRKITRKLQQSLPANIHLLPCEYFAKTLEKLGSDRRHVLLDPDIVAVWIYNRLEQAGAVIHKQPDPCLLPRACKTSTEIQGARASHLRDGVAIVQLLAWLSDQVKAKKKITELDVAAQLYQFRCQNSLFRGTSFETIAGSGPNGAIVHYRPTPVSNRVVQHGELLLLDSGGQYLDGTTDITRTMAIGDPTPIMKKHFTLVLKGHISLAMAKFPKGVSGHQLDAIARYHLWQHGLNYDHGTGHGVGSYLSVHEGPQRIATAPNQVALQPGMILSNEPGYYKKGAYGIRLENLVLVVPAIIDGAEREMLGFETLTLAPFDRRLIDVSLLTVEELGWLNNYHQQVQQQLAQHLNQQSREYLNWATAKLTKAS
ncbi:MAG TPA: M24 family metallopeptidase [Alphaproteobacteria bacterium]|nr:M24 family metallopeptidase [Alphaproteobacteria bacterium]